MDEVDRLLAIPEGVYPLFGLCVGVPAEEPPLRPRLPVEAVLFDDAYPSDEAMLELIGEYDGAYREHLRGRGAQVRTWSQAISGKFVVPVRVALAGYSRSMGADLS